MQEKLRCDPLEDNYKAILGGTVYSLFFISSFILIILDPHIENLLLYSGSFFLVLDFFERKKL